VDVISGATAFGFGFVSIAALTGSSGSTGAIAALAIPASDCVGVRAGVAHVIASAPYFGGVGRAVSGCSDSGSNGIPVSHASSLVGGPSRKNIEKAQVLSVCSHIARASRSGAKQSNLSSSAADSLS
jgi:hypothetical protein